MVEEKDLFPLESGFEMTKVVTIPGGFGHCEIKVMALTLQWPRPRQNICHFNSKRQDVLLETRVQ